MLGDLGSLISQGQRAGEASALGDAQGWQRASAGLRQGPQRSTMSPQEKAACQISLCGFIAHQKECFAQLPLFLTPEYQRTDRHHLLASEFTRTGCASWGWGRIPKASALVSLLSFPRQAGNMLQILCYLPRRVSKYQWYYKLGIVCTGPKACYLSSAPLYSTYWLFDLVITLCNLLVSQFLHM